MYAPTRPRTAVLLCLCMLAAVSNSAYSRSYGHELQEALLDKYQKNYRPVAMDNQTLEVKVGLRLVKIIDLDTFHGDVTAFVWEKQKWTDSQLVWNPDSYGGVSTIHIPASKLWQPDVVLLNSVGPSQEVQSNLLAKVRKNGLVEISKPVIRKTSCKIFMKSFPFDKHECIWKYGSMVYDDSLMNVKPFEDAYAIMTDYTPSGEWFVNETEVWNEKVKSYHPDSNSPFVSMSFYVKISRSSRVYVMTLLWPAAILSLLIPFIFLMPPPTSDKIRLSLAVLFGSLILFMYVITKILPQNAKDYPIIVEFIKWNVYNSLCAMLASAFVVNIDAKRHTQPVPKCIKLLFVKFLSRVLCIKCNLPTCCCRRGHLAISQEDDLAHELHDMRVTHGKFTSPAGQNEAWQVKLTSNLAMLNTNVQNMLTFCKQNFDTQYRKKKASDWIIVAMVFDRIFFILSLVATALLWFFWLSNYPQFPLQF